MVPAMTLDTYLAGWSIAGADRKQISSVILSLCNALEGSRNHEAAGLLLNRLRRSFGECAVGRIEVDGEVRFNERASDALEVSVTRDGAEAVYFAVQKASGQTRRAQEGLQASGQITIGDAMTALINVGKGTVLFVEDANGGRLRVARSAPEGAMPIAA